jgi:hypothetical protein
MRMYSIAVLWMVTGISAVLGQARLPSILFDSVSKDMGRITQGEVGRLVFSFSNKGGAVLEIFGVEPT